MARAGPGDHWDKTMHARAMTFQDIRGCLEVAKETEAAITEKFLRYHVRARRGITAVVVNYQCCVQAFAVCSVGESYDIGFFESLGSFASDRLFAYVMREIEKQEPKCTQIVVRERYTQVHVSLRALRYKCTEILLNHFDKDSGYSFVPCDIAPETVSIKSRESRP